MMVNCCHGKGIKFIGEDLIFFLQKRIYHQIKIQYLNPLYY